MVKSQDDFKFNQLNRQFYAFKNPIDLFVTFMISRARTILLKKARITNPRQ
jgi:hypothetical protein